MVLDHEIGAGVVVVRYGDSQPRTAHPALRLRVAGDDDPLVLNASSCMLVLLVRFGADHIASDATVGA